MTAKGLAIFVEGPAEGKEFVRISSHRISGVNGHRLYVEYASQELSSRNERVSTILTSSRDSDWLLGDVKRTLLLP